MSRSTSRAVVKRSRGIADRMSQGVGFLLKKNKVDVIWGAAKLAGKGKVVVEKAENAPKGALGPGEYSAKHIIVATGARPRALPGLEPDKKLVWTYFEAMVPTRHAEVAARRRLGRDRHRVRLVLPHARRRGDGRRDPAADPSRRGRGDRRARAQALREAGDEDPHRGEGHEARQGQERRDRHASS